MKRVTLPVEYKHGFPVYPFLWHKLDAGLPVRGQLLMIELYGGEYAFGTLKGWSFHFEKPEKKTNVSFKLIRHWTYFHYPTLDVTDVIQDYYTSRLLREDDHFNALLKPSKNKQNKITWHKFKL